jgi:DNA-binding NarL/FixJ family response regulator
MKESTIRLVVFSSQPLFRTGIALSLSKFDRLHIMMACSFTEKTLDELVHLLPDVIVIDIDDNQEEAEHILFTIQAGLSGPGIIVMSGKETNVSRILESPDTTFYPKNITADELYTAVIMIANRQDLDVRPHVETDTFTKLAERSGLLILDNNHADVPSPLTTREREVLGYVALGYLNKQIADALGISTETIKNHITSSLRKLNATSRTDAVVQAIKQGLITVK